MKQAKVLSQDETKRVLSVIAQDRHADRNRMAFQFSLLAGLRACEIASLTIGDVMDSAGKPKSEIYLAQSMTKGKSNCSRGWRKACVATRNMSQSYV